MRIKRMKKKCSVPRCRCTDTIAIGVGTALDVGCVFLCKEHAKAYSKAWSDAEKAEREAARGEE